MDIFVDPAWDALFRELSRHAGVVVFLGATDSGKSTLARYLTERFVSESRSVVLVDSDIGQSSLGLPGTIAMGLFRAPEDLVRFTFDRMLFVGSLNPAKRIRPMIEATKKMVSLGRTAADAVLVDTTGLISGETGRALKTSKIKALQPACIVAIQRKDELEPILQSLENVPIYRCSPSPMAKTRSRTERIAYRKKKFDDYFAKCRTDEFSLSGVEFLYNGASLIVRHNDFKEGTIIGLNHKDNTIALGILVECLKDSVTFRTSVTSLKRVDRVVFGDIVL